jgi:hypothetical protein
VKKGISEREARELRPDTLETDVGQITLSAHVVAR